MLMHSYEEEVKRVLPAWGSGLHAKEHFLPALPCSLCVFGIGAAAAKLARQYPAVRLHTHLAENQQDIDYSNNTYGCRPGGYLT